MNNRSRLLIALGHAVVAPLLSAIITYRVKTYDECPINPVNLIKKPEYEERPSHNLFSKFFSKSEKKNTPIIEEDYSIYGSFLGLGEGRK